MLLARRRWPGIGAISMLSSREEETSREEEVEEEEKGGAPAGGAELVGTGRVAAEAEGGGRVPVSRSVESRGVRIGGASVETEHWFDADAEVAGTAKDEGREGEGEEAEEDNDGGMMAGFWSI